MMSISGSTATPSGQRSKLGSSHTADQSPRPSGTRASASNRPCFWENERSVVSTPDTYG